MDSYYEWIRILLAGDVEQNPHTSLPSLSQGVHKAPWGDLIREPRHI